MKKLLFTFLIILSTVSLKAQYDITAGMGITFQSTPSIKDYIDNSNPGSGSDKLAEYSSAINFFGEVDYSLSPTFSLGIEYENKLFSYNGTNSYDLSYTTHSPSILAYYVVEGAGYQFKFGGGAGYRIVSVDEKFGVLENTASNFTANGFGLLLKAQAHTLLGGDFYASVGGDIRYDLIGEATNGDQEFGSNVLDEKVNFNTLAFSVKLGISYFLR